MQDSQDVQDDVLGEKVMDSLGVSEDNSADQQEQQNEPSDKENELPKYAKEKLGMQEKRHKKEMRKMQAQLDELSSRFGSQSAPDVQQQNQYSSTQNNQSDDPMQHVVQAAMQAIEKKQKDQQDLEQKQHYIDQHHRLQEEVENASDKYEDFDDIVTNNKNLSFSNAMKDASILLPNKIDVMYKLGKNPDESERISKLHPIEQAKEMVKLSIALMGGNGSQQSPNAVKTIGNIKSNPNSNSSSQVNEKTSISEIRRRMKAGWK